jgi:hypothetical protein
MGAKEPAELGAFILHGPHRSALAFFFKRKADLINVVKSPIFRFVRVSGRDFGGG